MLELLNKAWKVLVAKRDAEGNLGKSWWRSKTLGLNAVVLVGAIVFHFTGIEMDGEVVAGFLAVLNYALRLITKDPVGFIDVDAK